MTKKAVVAIIMEHPGVRACGRYMAGVVYPIKGDTELSEKEVKRLIDIKGFTGLTADQVDAIEAAKTKAIAEAEQQSEETPVVDNAAESDT